MGGRRRNSDNTLLKQTLGWEPRISLDEGWTRTYRWIKDRVRAQSESAKPVAMSQAASVGCA